MRWLAGAGLFALVGCNQIFGLQETRAFDAAPDGVLDRPHVTLDWQVATTALGPDLNRPGVMIPYPVPPTFAPIVPKPKVRIAPLHVDPNDANSALGTFGDPEGGYLETDGTITIPRAYITQPWRLEYTLADGMPHEVQWQPEDKKGHITVPLFGRLDRSRPEPGAGYTISPSQAPTSYTFPRIFTTGLWTEGSVPPGFPPGATLDYNFDESNSLSGVKGAPDAQQGDQAILMDYVFDAPSSCRMSTGAAAFDPTINKPHQTLNPPWIANLVSLTTNAPGTAPLNGLGSLIEVVEPDFSLLALGVLPSTAMPGLAGKLDSLFTVFNTPVMITLLRCPSSVNGKPLSAHPEVLGGLPRAVHVQLVGSRTVLGTKLFSGTETVVPVVADLGDRATLSFPAPYPTSISLTAPSGATIDIAGGDTTPDQQSLPTSTQAFTLKLAPDVGQQADYYDVLLRKIEPNTGLETKRIYTVMAPLVEDPITHQRVISVLIDGAFLETGINYTFEIHAYIGHPQALQGDLSAISYPYAATITTTRTFKITPD